LPNKPAYQTSRFSDQQLLGPAGELLRPAAFGKAPATPNRALTKYYSFSAETKQKNLYMCNPKILLTFTRQCMPKALGDQDKKREL